MVLAVWRSRGLLGSGTHLAFPRLEGGRRIGPGGGTGAGEGDGVWVDWMGGEPWGWHGVPAEDGVSGVSGEPGDLDGLLGVHGVSGSRVPAKGAHGESTASQLRAGVLGGAGDGGRDTVSLNGD